MTRQTSNHEPGPLQIPLPSDTKTRVAMAEHLRGYTTSERWLPEGLWPELDELRAEQLRLRDQVAADLDALHDLLTKFRLEDREHQERLLQAHRDGRPTSAEDRRTPAGHRAAARTTIEERLWAGALVFAEHAEHVIDSVREHEDEWLVDLRSQLTGAEEKRREAERLLAEARAEEFHVQRLGQWVQATADDEAFGRQPAPTVQPVPRRFSPDALKGSLERPRHKAKPWNGAKTGAAA
jgi:hypothetical protein